MKKIVVILLISIYALATMGFSLKQFYCCGKLQSITVSITNDIKQKSGKGTEKSGCCDNKYQFFKVKDKYIAADDICSPVKHIIDLHSFTPSFHDITLASPKFTLANRSNAPPLHAGVSNYIYNCILRI